MLKNYADETTGGIGMKPLLGGHHPLKDTAD